MELQQSQNTVNGTHNNDSSEYKGDQNQLVERIPLHPPFVAMKYKEEWYVTMGKYTLGGPFKTFEEAKTDSTDSSWLRILAIMKAVIYDHEEEKQLKTTINKQQQELDFRKHEDQNELDLENKTSL